MSGLLEAFLVLWGTSMIVLAAALVIVVLVQGATHRVAALASRVRQIRRPVGMSLRGRETSPV